MVLVLAGSVVVAAPAQAAAIDGQLTNVESVITGGTGTIGWNTSYDIDFNACVPNSAQTGDSWTVTLPAQLDFTPSKSLTIWNPNDSTEAWIEVTVEGNIATYTLTEAGAAQSNLCFLSTMGGTLKRDLQPGTETLTVEHAGAQVTSKTITVQLPPPPNPWIPQTMAKSMWFTNYQDQCRTTTTECIHLTLITAAGDHGVVTIEDTAQGAWEFVCTTGNARLFEVRDGVEYRTDGSDYLVEPVVCGPDSVTVVFDTAGLTANQHLRYDLNLTAAAPSIDGGVTYNNTATFTSADGTPETSTHVTSNYIGGTATGAFLTIVKSDDAGNDANTAAESVFLETGETGLNFTITNTGSQDLTDVEVTDAVTAGGGSVANLVCFFPDGTEGTTWAGPFEKGTGFQCTADLSGVMGEHADVASVTAKGEGGEPVSAEDPYHAHGPLPEVSVGDYVWLDVNRDGLQDSTDVPLAGVTLTLTGPDGGPVTDVDGNPVAPAITDANGKYLFEGLPVLQVGQSYTVTVTAPAGYVPTTAGAGTDSALDSSTGSAASGPLTADGASDLTLDFGFVLPKVSVGDYVWFDSDRDGIQEQGEPGIPGITLNLTGPDGAAVTDVFGNPVGPTKTDDNGKYLFENLPALPAGQHYTVTMSPPAGYVPTVAGAGSDRAVDSSTGSATSGDLVTDGASDLTLDFGFAPALPTPPSPPTPPTPNPPLPVTGLDSGGTLLIALGALFTGGGLLALAGKRRQA